MHIHPNDSMWPLYGGVAVSDKFSRSGGETYIGPSLVLSAGPNFNFANGRHERNIQAAIDEERARVAKMYSLDVNDKNFDQELEQKLGKGSWSVERCFEDYWEHSARDYYENGSSVTFAVQGFAEGSTTRQMGGLDRNWGMTVGGKLTTIMATEIDRIIMPAPYVSLLGGLAVYTQNSPQKQHPVVGVEAGVPLGVVGLGLALPGFKVSSVLNPQDPSEFEVNAGVAVGW